MNKKTEKNQEEVKATPKKGTCTKQCKSDAAEKRENK